MPEHNAVIAITSGLNDMQAVLNEVWTHLLPGMGPAPLPDNAESAAALAERLHQLSLTAPQLVASSPREIEFVGQYRLEENSLRWETFNIGFDDSEAAFKLKDHNGEHQFRSGRGAWIEQLSRLNQGIEQQIAASFSWRDPDALELTVRYLETPFCFTAVCCLDEEQIAFEIKPNVNFGSNDPLEIKGARVTQ
jgi:hypothetical protein